MTLLHLIVLLAVFGVGLYLLNSLVTTMDPKIKKIINVLVVTVLGIVTLVWLLGFLGISTGLDLGGPSYRR